MSGTNGGYDQSATRRPGTVYDQHDRPWGCSIDKKSGFPVGLIYPKGWRAPWRPNIGPETAIFDKDNPTRFRINYEWLLEQRVKAADEYDKERSKAAVVRGWDPLDPEKQNALDQIVGDRAGLQHPELIVACMQGDQWILGLTDKVNPKVAPYVTKKERGANALLKRFPNLAADTAVEPESIADDIDTLMDIEEQHDPEATPKGRVPMKPKKQPKAVA
jgi:hypothetical protein